MTYFNGVDRQELGDTGIAFIDNIVNKVKGVVGNEVQRVTEKVADFKLLPRTHRGLEARLAALAATTGVKGNAALAQNVSGLRAALTAAEGQWTVTNTTLDSVLSQIDAIKAGKLSASTLTTAASLVTGMNDAFNKAKSLDASTRSVEAVVLTPDQQKAALSIQSSANGSAGMSLPLLALLAAGGFVLVKTMKK